MAKPITQISRPILTPEQKERETLESLITEVASHKEGIQDTLELLQELHKSGLLPALTALLEAKEKVAEILLHQTTRPEVTQLINHSMGALGAISNLSVETTGRVLKGVTSGMSEAEEYLSKPESVSLFSLLKLMKDPDINRAIGFGAHFLKGLGKGLSQES